MGRTHLKCPSLLVTPKHGNASVLGPIPTQVSQTVVCAAARTGLSGTLFNAPQGQIWVP